MNTRVKSLDRLADMVRFPAAVRTFNSWIVALYKLFGFGVLIALVLGMLAFVSVNLFFLLNHSWVVPNILTPQGERVQQANLSFLQQEREVERMRADQVATASELNHVKRAVQLQEQFQTNFLAALAADSTKKLSKLRHLSAAGKEMLTSTGAGSTAGADFGDLARRRLEAQYKARLIGQDDLLKGHYMVGQIAASDLSHREKLFDVNSEAAQLAQEVAAQDELARALARGETGAVHVLNPEVFGGDRHHFSVDVLAREQQYLAAEISKSELMAKLAPLELRLSDIAQALPPQELALKRMKDSPFVRAAGGKVTVAFVPYSNMPNVREGDRVVGCRLGFVFCSKVGTIRHVLEGETNGRHPMNGHELRGVMVELELDEPSWAEERALSVNDAPLLF